MHQSVKKGPVHYNVLSSNQTELTTVVKNAKIKPLYSLQEVQVLVSSGGFETANRRASERLLSLDWTIATVQSFLLALTEKHFHKSYFAVSAYDGRLTIDIDAYKMHFDEENLCAGSNSDCCYWTKIALRTKKSGQVVAVVSFHLDGSP